MTNQTPAELRAKADALRQEAQDSFDRCDTDGFLSQWAHGINAQKLDLEAKLAEAGGISTFPALFDLQGNRVPAKLVSVKDKFNFGRPKQLWLVVDPATNRAAAWITPLAWDYKTVGNECVAKPNTRSLNRLRAQGYVEGEEQAPAKVEVVGTNACNVHAAIVRADGGFPGAK